MHWHIWSHPYADKFDHIHTLTRLITSILCLTRLITSILWHVWSHPYSDTFDHIHTLTHFRTTVYHIHTLSDTIDHTHILSDTFDHIHILFNTTFYRTHILTHLITVHTLFSMTFYHTHILSDTSDHIHTLSDTFWSHPYSVWQILITSILCLTHFDHIHTLSDTFWSHPYSDRFWSHPYSFWNILITSIHWSKRRFITSVFWHVWSHPLSFWHVWLHPYSDVFDHIHSLSDTFRSHPYSVWHVWSPSIYCSTRRLNKSWPSFQQPMEGWCTHLDRMFLRRVVYRRTSAFSLSGLSVSLSWVFYLCLASTTTWLQCRQI